MKTIFTLIFIVIVVSGGFAQKTNTSVQKSGMFASASIPAEQSFSISKIYPNPVKDFVTVDIHSELTGNIQISLFNILGTEVKKWEPWYVSQGSQEFRIDLSSIKSGVYILKVVKSGAGSNSGAEEELIGPLVTNVAGALGIGVIETDAQQCV